MSDFPVFDFACIPDSEKDAVHVHGLPNGAVGEWLVALARNSPRTNHIYVAAHLADASATADAVHFFSSGTIKAEVFPAWDCAPYDRSSPGDAIQSERARLLHEWATEIDRLSLPTNKDTVRWVIVPINGLLQWLPKPEYYRQLTTITLQQGGSIKQEILSEILVSLGFQHVDTVFRPGEFVRRGGVFDVFPAGNEHPIRLDFFGDTIENLHYFDPLSQRRMQSLSLQIIAPCREIILNDTTIKNFRRKYRESFGLSVSHDALYAAVSAGNRHTGMEHWLPMFFDDLGWLGDYFKDSLWVLGKGVVQGAFDKLNEIDAYFNMRHQHHQDTLGKAPTKQRTEDLAEIYKPIEPHTLYPQEDDFTAFLSKIPLITLDSSLPLTYTTMDSALQPPASFHAERALEGVSGVLNSIRDKASEAWKGKIKLILAPHRATQIQQQLQNIGLTPRMIDDWALAKKHAPHVFYMTEALAQSGCCSDRYIIISEDEILGQSEGQRVRRKKNAKNTLLDMASINVGDLVIHIEHGVGRYLGLTTVNTGHSQHDCLKIEYAENGILYVPVVNIELISVYGESDAEQCPLDRMGSAQWQARKARVRGRIKDIAEGLIALAAHRQAIHLPIPDIDWEAYQRFKSNITFTLTEDQQNAIDDLIDDVQRGYPMDRLICGDVGFGKTEIAMHALFLMAQTGGQVAFLAPTTLLAAQHYRSLQRRLQGFGFQIALRSRANTPKQTVSIQQGLADGHINIVVGTHALLSKKSKFQNLSLLIVDEEQRFGVTQKEHLKALRTEIHVLSLSATPIPRTLNMALSGVRDLSLIATAPVDRLAIRTILEPIDEVSIKRALLREKDRQGQSYVVTPRIKFIPEIEAMLARTVPELRYAVVHGRMKQDDLDKAMQQFADGTLDILLATSIIESGIDVARANTMIVHRPDLFGLSQLYQIRGRIGRSTVRANCYLCLPKRGNIHPNAAARLDILQTLDNLGASFSLAHHDMDLRGAGNLVGAEQSGHINEVGIELYHHMLSEALEVLKQGETWNVEQLINSDTQKNIEINLGVSVGLPEDYVTDLATRLAQYRRIARLETPEDISAMQEELQDRFGSLPPESHNLLQMVRIKFLAKHSNIIKLDANEQGLTIKFFQNSFCAGDKLVQLLISQPSQYRLLKDERLQYSHQDFARIDRRISATLKFLEYLQQLLS